MSDDEIFAREKAVQYARNVAPVPSDSASDHCAGFLAGWKAARDHRAAQEPTDAEVEAVAMLLYLTQTLYHTKKSWEREPSPIHIHYRQNARAALAAARAVRQGI